MFKIQEPINVNKSEERRKSRDKLHSKTTVAEGMPLSTTAVPVERYEHTISCEQQGQSVCLKNQELIIKQYIYCR